MQTIKEYVLQTFEPDQMKDIVRQGMVVGFHPLIYYHETGAFYEKHECEIWEVLRGDCEQMGYRSVMDMISTFNGASSVQDGATFKNLLCWYVVECVCYSIIEENGVSNA